MRIHVMGIGGTFMAGIALIARQLGAEVTGTDLNTIYPPMSTQLATQGISVSAGFDPANFDKNVDCVIVGNVVSRGNPLMEYILEHQIPYYSGPEWLAKNVLQNRSVLAVSGTHGKTTTTSMLAWILEFAGLNPGFLVGGIPENFGISARVGESPFFVIEADEYDSAFFDKRSKFIHYRPKTLILNNLEYDHADIFPDLSAIQQQFHYLVRTVPANGLIIRHEPDQNIIDTLKKGCWTKVATFGSENAEWSAKLKQADGSEFDVYHQQVYAGTATWQLLGMHNVNNALAAIAAAHNAGVPITKAIEALSSFKNVKRRLEIKGSAHGITLYDDFAHHPTAIATTLQGLRAKVGKEARIIAVLEFGSYTMRSGVHKDQMKDALREANLVYCKSPEGKDWGLKDCLKQFSQPTALFDQVDDLVKSLKPMMQTGDHVIVMSNSGFGGIHEKLLTAISSQEKESSSSFCSS